MVPSDFTGPLREAYLAGHKVCNCLDLALVSSPHALNSFQSGYAAGIQVKVDVRLDSGKNLKAVEYSGGIQQV